MPVHLRFSFLGEQQVDRTLLGLADRARDMRPVWDELERRFTDFEEKWFGSEGDGTWAPLSPSYRAWKEKHFPGEPILQRQRDLYRSVTKPDIAVKEPGYAIFGTADPVAAIHQRRGGRLPVRRVIDLDEDERSEWVRVAQRHLINEEGGSGL